MQMFSFGPYKLHRTVQLCVCDCIDPRHTTCKNSQTHRFHFFGVCNTMRVWSEARQVTTKCGFRWLARTNLFF